MLLPRTDPLSRSSLKRCIRCNSARWTMWWLLTTAVLLADGRIASAASDPGKHHYNISGVLNGLQVGYDKRVRPNYGGIPVEIAVSMGIITISSLSEVTMDFTLDMYFRQYWRDSRLSFQQQKGVETLSVSTEYLRNMWVPDTFFANEKKAYLHMVTTSNEFVRIRHDGEITRSMRVTITASCPMNLQYFPLDSQLCPIEIESFGFTTNEIWYKWVDGPKGVSIFPEVELPQFRVMGYRKREYMYSLTTGNYSRLGCDIQFVRSMGYYLIQIYIPSSLIVVISWVSFWLNRNATPARVLLGVTTVLTMTTLMSSTNASLPKISYVKSIDIYLGTCFVMVFASLLEYAAVGYLAKRIEMRKKRYQNLHKLAEQRRAAMASSNAASGDGETASTVAKSHCTNKSGSTVVQVTAVADGDDLTLVSQGKNLNVMYGASPSVIDKYSRVIFPVCFTCFHLMYWVIYLHISEVTTEDITLHNPSP